MKFFVEPVYARILTSLYYLVIESPQLNIETCAKINETSQQTAAKDLEFIYLNYGEMFHAEYNNDVLSFKNRSIGILNAITHDVLSYSVPVNLLVEIMCHPRENRNFYTERLGISDASFYRLIKHVNKKLNASGHEIASISGKYFIKSKNEKALRNYLAIFLMQSQNIDDALLGIKFSDIREFFYQARYALAGTKDDSLMNYLTFYYFVSYLREYQGFYYYDKYEECLEEDKDIISNFPDLAEVKNVCKLMTEKSYHTIKHDLSYHFLPWKTLEQKDFYIKHLSRLSTDICQLLPCELEEGFILKVLINALGYRINYPNAPEQFINRAQIFAREFAVDNPYFQSEFHKLFTKYDATFSEDFSKISNYVLFIIHINCPKTYMSLGDPKVAIRSDLGPKHIKYLKTVIGYVFKDFIFVSEDEADLIIATNITIDEAHDKNIIAINDYPSLFDLQNIRHTIQNLLTEKNKS